LQVQLYFHLFYSNGSGKCTYHFYFSESLWNKGNLDASKETI